MNFKSPEGGMLITWLMATILSIAFGDGPFMYSSLMENSNLFYITKVTQSNQSANCFIRTRWSALAIVRIFSPVNNKQGLQQGVLKVF